MPYLTPKKLSDISLTSCLTRFFLIIWCPFSAIFHIFAKQNTVIMRMKPYHSFIIFLAFMVSAICASVNSYRCAEGDIISDMNQALVITLHDSHYQWLTPDTIQDYRSHLRINLLKETSNLCYVVDDRHESTQDRDSQQLTSNAMTLNSHAIRGYANCSFADVFGMSDQRTPLSLTLMAMMWATAAIIYHRRRNGMWNHKKSSGLATVGTLSYSTNDDCFYNSVSQQAVRFTPMQHQLMQMFFNSTGHQLSKADICSALWPKKPDASDTLYTLIRRVKPIVEAYGLAIEVERGRAYRLIRSK